MKKTIFITLFLLLSLFLGTSSAVAGEVTLFGPKQYVRTTGAPNIYTDTFSAILGEGKLTIKNGDEAGDHRLSSSVILVNGEQVLGPDDLNQEIYCLEVPINLAENNSIYIELASIPGSYLTIQVTQEAEPPTVSISAVPETIPVNEPSTLSWSSSNADSAVISDGIGSVPVTGSIMVTPTETTTYTIMVTGAGGITSASVTVTVNYPTPTVTISASADSIHYGESTTLTWSSTHAHACIIEPDIGPVDNEGSVTVSPTRTATYIITGSNPAGTGAAAITVTVNLDIDLEAVNIELSNTSVNGQTLEFTGTINVEVVNRGTTPVEGSFEVTLFEDTNANELYDEAGDQIIGSTDITRASMAGEALLFPVDVEANVLFKDNRIFAFVDSANAIQETNEENNITHSMANCQYIPPVGSFDPVLEWEWTESDILPEYNEVMSTPVVANLNDDNGDGKVDQNDVPDIIFVSFSGGGPDGDGFLRAISGDGSGELFTISDHIIRPGNNVAVGDIDNDGLVEIVAYGEWESTLRVLAFENDGTFKWDSEWYSTSSPSWGTSPITIADIDNDGNPEIIRCSVVMNGDGTTKWFAPIGCYSIVADINLDGKSEIVGGNTVCDSNGDVLWVNDSVPRGFHAVANLDDDPYAEIVNVSSGYVYLLEHTGDVIWGPIDLPPSGTYCDHGGPPTIADFDSDGEPEIGIAGGYSYVVFESDGRVKWTSPTQDLSSNSTGSSVFDFDGDGSVEVVYADERYLRIYRGTDGEILFQTPIGSGTLLEYPLIVDVDNDNNAEIVVPSNDYYIGPKTGIQVFGDANDTWVNTRKIWNQYAYSITNVNDDGTIPQYPARNWEIYNNFRCNQSLDALACVDLTASYVRVDNSNLPDSMDIIARIGNGGALHVAPGLDVSFYDSDPQAGGTCLGTVIIGNRLNPGTYEDVSFHWTNPPDDLYEIYVVADDNGMGHGTVSEINEDNNVASATFSLGNYTPTADAGADQTVIEGDSVFLDGSGSSDPEADPLTYQWSFAGQPDGSAATLSDPSAVNPSFVADVAGTYIIQLIVSDGTMSSNIDTIKVITTALVAVPDVVGMAQPAASSLITYAGLTPGSVTQVYSDTVPAGKVISQDPEPQTILLIGSAVDLVVSQGVHMVTVPDVTGLLQADAEAAINTGELSVGSVTEEYIDIQPAGHVFQQDPPAGTLAPHDTPVDIAVSLGIWPVEDEEDEEPPSVSITVFPDQVYIGETVTLTVMASDNVGVVERSLTVYGTPVTLVDEQAFYVAATAGVFTAEASATDGVGLTSTVAVDFVVIEAPYDTTPPVVSLDDQDCIDVTDLYPITGSVFDENDFSYQLMAREKGTTEWVTFVEGTGSGAAITGELGVFDPTIRRNGVYEIFLEAEDAAGNSASVYGCALVDGGLKVGQVEIPATDMSLPQLGFSLSLDRQYDSRSTGSGDFGPGWNLAASDVKAAATTTLGSGWAESISGDMFATYYLIEQYRHVVVIRLSDTDVLKFTTDVNPKSSILIPLENHTPLTVSYQPIDGIQASIEALDADPHVLLIENHLREPDLDVYNPARFRVTRIDGTAYVISTLNGIESMTDVYGHTVDYDANGIHHSSGASITFERGAGNRIERITDQFGGVVEYHYDENGYLSQVVQVKTSGAANLISQYGYTTGVFERPVLKTITAPDGTELGQFEYDSSGRMTALIDANGNRIIYGYDVPNHQQVITDRLGNDTLYEYDNEGNVTTKTDPMGHMTQWTYDENGHKLTETDPLGNTTNYTHDPYGNLLTETDPLGNTTIYAYNDMNQVLTITDALGNTTTNTYDANGNLLTTTDPEGGVTAHTYDADGNLASTTDALGNTTTYTYDANGNMISETDPLGNTTTYTYDGYGNKLTQTVTRTTESGPVTMTTVYEYDDLDRLIKETDPDGYYVEMEYNDIDKMTDRVDKNGNRTEYGYDPQGNQTAINYADGTTEVYTYEAEGNRLTSTDRAGRTTGYDYDLLNRLIGTTYLDGSTTQMQYDTAGRLIATIDENGNRTEFAYDTAGRRTGVTDALAHVTTFTYDDNGNQLTMTDANGNTTEYVYDGLNRRIKTIYPHGTFSTVGYDGMGRRVSETDQAGNTTHFEYDAMGRLTMVSDALGAETRYAYDEVGNKISQTDPNGNTTSRAYDNLGKFVSHTVPLGMSESFTYDANGNMVSKTDFNGDTTTYTYDALNRLTEKTYADSSQVSFTYTATGRRETVTDPEGVTSYTYDQRDRLTEVINPDGTSIAYTYDAKGNRTLVTVPSGTTHYAFDALNRLSTVTEPDGDVTTYTYDSVGNRKTVGYPNGTVAEYTYDTLNRLTYLENRKSTGEIISSYTYTLGSAGNRTRVEEHTGRVVDYSYDVLYRLTQENITDPVLGNETISYTYDAFGNRLTKTDSTGTTAYTYNENDQLLTEVGPGAGYSYAYDNKGNTILKTDGTNSVDYVYDYENRLVSLQTGTSQADYAYDADGIRIRSTVDGAVTNFLVDKNRPHAQVLEETDDTSSLTVCYIYGDDLISQHRAGISSYYHYDGQMSTRQLTDNTETVTDTYVYDAFGILLDQTGATENNYCYTGEQYDANAAFYYLRARYYNQDVGRFITTDSWKGSKSDPLSLHKYLYAHANPVIYADPSGEFTLIQKLCAVTISNIIAGSAISIWSFHTMAASGFKINGILLSVRFDISYLGGAAGGGVDVLLENNSGKYYASVAGEFGLDPLSVFKKRRGGGFTAIAGLVFGLSNPNQLSEAGVTAFWPTSVLRLMPIIGGKSNIWGTMTQFAQNVTKHKGAVVGFGRSLSGPGMMYFGTSYRMFSSMVSYNSEFVPIDQISSEVRYYAERLSKIARDLAALGRDMSSFSKNADQALNLLP